MRGMQRERKKKKKKEKNNQTVTVESPSSRGAQMFGDL